MRIGPEGQFGDFIEGLGPSQLVGRQVLGSPCLGEIQLGIADRKGHLEVEVIRARGLMAKIGAKVLPGEFHIFMANKFSNLLTHILQYNCFQTHLLINIYLKQSIEIIMTI